MVNKRFSLQNLKKTNDALANSALSSTKDNSLNQIAQKKKFFLNPDSNKDNYNIKNPIANINNNFEINKKQKITFPDQSTYEGGIKNNEFEGYGEYKSKNYNYYGYYFKGKKMEKGNWKIL